MRNNYRLDVTFKLVLAGGTFLSEELFKQQIVIGLVEFMEKGITTDVGLRLKTQEVKNSLKYDEHTGQATWQVDIIPTSIKHNKQYLEDKLYHAVFDFDYRMPGESRFYVCNYTPVKITYADSESLPEDEEALNSKILPPKVDRKLLAPKSSNGWTPLEVRRSDPYVDVSETIVMIEPQTLRIM